MALLKNLNYLLTFLISIVLGMFIPVLILWMFSFSDIEGVLAICILVASLIWAIYFAYRVAKYEKLKMQNFGVKGEILLFLALLLSLSLLNPIAFIYFPK